MYEGLTGPGRDILSEFFLRKLCETNMKDINILLSANEIQ